MKKLSVCGIVIVFSLIVALPSLADAAARIALVIGNSNYKSAPLKNPANDAQDMSDTLRDLNFDVIEKIDADKRAMVKAVNTFGKKLHKSDVGIFFYAGHGMQIQGRNFLIPVGARVKSESDVEFEGVHAGRILGKMEEADNKLNIVILDACRDNPFKRSFRMSEKGLAQMNAPIGSIVAYATSPGSVAADGSGRNGVYTKHLLSNLESPDLSVQEVFTRTGLEVMKETGRKQVPWTSSTPVEKFYLAGADAVVEQPSADSSGSGTLKVRTTPTDAEVFIDSRFKGKSPKDIHGLDAGPHTIRAEKDGYEPQRKKVRVRPGRTATVLLYLDKEEQTGRLYVHPTPDDAEVKIMNIGPPYHDGIELDPGKYQVRVEKNGYETREQWESVRAGEDLDVYIELEEKPAAGHLFVRTRPSDAQIRLANVDRDYHYRMKLKAGEYQIEVSKAGYETERQWVTLSAGESLRTTITLKKEGPRPGDTWTDSVTGMEFVWVEGGCYMMGSNSGNGDEKPVHEVCVDGFWMGRYEVTIDQYRKYLQSTGGTSGVDWDDDDCPVRKGGSYSLAGNKFSRSGSQPMVEVSWHGAKAFAAWLSDRTGKAFRLPTEAEWEYAARSGGKKEKYAGGGNAGRVAWYTSNSGGRTNKVGTKAPNGLGLYDMSGNVWEWCADWYSSSAYESHARKNPIYDSGGPYRVARGGGWYNDSGDVRCANRYYNGPGDTRGDLGFRLLRKE